MSETKQFRALQALEEALKAARESGATEANPDSSERQITDANALYAAARKTVLKALELEELAQAKLPELCRSLQADHWRVNFKADETVVLSPEDSRRIASVSGFADEVPQLARAIAALPRFMRAMNYFNTLLQRKGETFLVPEVAVQKLWACMSLVHDLSLVEYTQRLMADPAFQNLTPQGSTTTSTYQSPINYDDVDADFLNRLDDYRKAIFAELNGEDRSREDLRIARDELIAYFLDTQEREGKNFIEVQRLQARVKELETELAEIKALPELRFRRELERLRQSDGEPVVKEKISPVLPFDAEKALDGYPCVCRNGEIVSSITQKPRVPGRLAVLIDVGEHTVDMMGFVDPDQKPNQWDVFLQVLPAEGLESFKPFDLQDPKAPQVFTASGRKVVLKHIALPLNDRWTITGLLEDLGEGVTFTWDMSGALIYPTKAYPAQYHLMLRPQGETSTAS